MKKLRMIGIMSGTSLDGIDLVCVDFDFTKDPISWSVVASDCRSYSAEWKRDLATAHQLSGQDLMQLDAAYGQLLGEKVNTFIQNKGLKEIDAIASHGHTIFHQPEKGFTLQIGHGAHIQKVTKLKVISDFRSQDVALGGQGAPLVPIGDQLLFKTYDACINLGGFANISFQDVSQKRVAFDICPVNFVLNKLTQSIGLDFDLDGEIAKGAQVDNKLLMALENLPFYQEQAPKSLGREWVETSVFPLLERSEITIEAKVATFTQHVASQLAQVLNHYPIERVLLSGGGARNLFLIQKLKDLTTKNIVVADDFLIDYKEALIFALLGALKLQNKINVLASVTGAERDSSAGIIYS